MLNPFTVKWPFWVSGTVLALLAVLSLALFDDNIGLLENLTAAGESCTDAAEKHTLPDTPDASWQNLLLLGVFLGALAAAFSEKAFRFELKDEGGFFRTALCGLGGGFLMMSGIRLAGESVCGAFAAALQLAPGGWIFLVSMLLTGSLLLFIFSKNTSVRKTKSAGGKKK